MEFMEYNRNPMSLLKLKGLTRRLKQPRALSVEELQSLWTHLDEDTRTTSMWTHRSGFEQVNHAERNAAELCCGGKDVPNRVLRDR